MKINKLTTTAILIALAVVLSAIPVISLPFGGSVTFASAVPIVIISVMYGPLHGLLSGAVFGLIQYFLDPSGLESLATNMPMYLFSILLDYILAFALVGFAGAFIGKKRTAISAAVAGFCALSLRFLCHFISGIVIWGEYAEKIEFWGMHASGNSVSWYSFVYNATFMLPEIIITVAVLAILYKLPQMEKTLEK